MQIVKRPSSGSVSGLEEALIWRLVCVFLSAFAFLCRADVCHPKCRVFGNVSCVRVSSFGIFQGWSRGVLAGVLFRKLRKI